jgi:segregation and condensation protein B
VSAKRQRSKPRSKRAGDAIPAEILAEGSGPNEIVDATPQTLVEAAEDLVEKRKGRKRKAKASEAAEAAEGAAAESGDAMDADAEASTLEASDADTELAGDSDESAALEPSDADLDASENPDDANAFDAAAGNPPPDMSTSAEGESVAALEEAVMRAEAEAELGDAEDIEPSEEEELGAALPTTAASMDAAQLKNLVEALVVAADKPVTIQRLRQLTRVGDVKRLEQALVELAADYTNRGLVLQQVSGGYQFRTNTQYSVWVQQLIAGRPVRLSRAQLETLAIVAYRQPITRPEIDDIRGVDSSATLRLLLDRALIRTLGKKEDVGRPMLYGTTKDFLDFFSLGDLRELPTLREYSELTAESRKVMSDRLGVDPAGEPANDEMPGEMPDTVDAKPAVEVDAWGQVVNIPDDEPSTSDSSEPADELLASEANESADLATSDVSDSPADELATDDAAEGESVEMSASAEPSADADESAAAVRVDAWGQAITTEDTESDEDVAAQFDEPAVADEVVRDDEVVASSVDAASESDADIGAPAGGSIEDRIDLAGSDTVEHGDEGSDDEQSADDSTGGTDADDESLLAAPDEVIASEDRDEPDEPGDEPSSHD